MAWWKCTSQCPQLTKSTSRAQNQIPLQNNADKIPVQSTESCNFTVMHDKLKTGESVNVG